MEEEWRIAQEISQAGWPISPSEHSDWRLFLMIPHPLHCSNNSSKMGRVVNGISSIMSQTSYRLREIFPSWYSIARIVVGPCQKLLIAVKQVVLFRSKSSPAVPLSDVAACTQR